MVLHQLTRSELASRRLISITTPASKSQRRSVTTPMRSLIIKTKLLSSPSKASSMPRKPLVCTDKRMLNFGILSHRFPACQVSGLTSASCSTFSSQASAL